MLYEDPFGSPFTSHQILPHQSPQSPAASLPQPSIMSAPIVVPDFSGKPGDAIQSAEFLKKFRSLMNMGNIMENTCMISLFENYLKYNSPADEWFREINTMEMTWKTLEKEFLVRFPPFQKAKKSESELERELCELRLMATDLGKKVKYAGEDVWSHVTFTEKALSLA